MSAPGAPRLSLVFPVFDEERNLGPLLASALALAPRLATPFEVIVVDDGSRDRSAAVVEAWRRRDPRVRLLRHPANAGYGAALRSGLRAARGEWVFFTDADLQFDLAELGRLLAHTSRADLVIGYRAPRQDPWHRRAIARAWGLLVRALFGLRVRDIDCAFKVLHRPVLDALPFASLGAFVSTELLVRATRAGFRIVEVPVSHHPRRAGRAKGATPRVILRALLELAALHGELRRPAAGPGGRGLGHAASGPADALRYSSQTAAQPRGALTGLQRATVSPGNETS
ncbi:MAG: glycosyltransferase family 2 protein [Deltaproteobacteria bacterium]|nr:glycosyltransferase family 2 protein [Deltaproteobacteria bacterium]